MRLLERLRLAVGMPPYLRGPYLQHLRADGLTVCWRTRDETSASLLLRGPAEESLRPITGTLQGLDRRVKLRELTPGERYHYRLAPDSAEYSFRLPNPGAESFSFCAVGDHGRRCRGQAEVLALLQQLQPDFLMSMGDFAYSRSSDWCLDVNFFRPFAEFISSVVVWPTVGNHDFQKHEARELLRATETPDNGPEELPRGRAYWFDYGPLRFTVINSAERIQLRDVIVPWLKETLPQSPARWNILVSHHPPYSSGRYGNNLRLTRLVAPLLQDLGVDLVLSGHDHAYERLQPGSGPTYVVCGTGGGRLYKARSPRGDSVARISRTHGLLHFQVTGAELRGRFLDTAGVCRDEFAVSSSGETDTERAGFEPALERFTLKRFSKPSP